MPEPAALLLTRLDDLRRAERRAASARMVSVAGHLAGTPLNVIAGRAALIRADPSPAAVEENLRRIEEQVERMAQRMRRLIEYFGVSEPHSEHRGVGAILGECQALYSPVAELKGVSLLIEPGGVDHLHIEADVSELVLTTLLSLGVRKTAPGQSITLSAAAHGLRSVLFELALPDLEVPHNFERFEPPEHGISYDPGILETCWTCLGLARRIGGTLSIAKAASEPGAIVHFACAHD
jgi:signal transduction histidine kinase